MSIFLAWTLGVMQVNGQVIKFRPSSDIQVENSDGPLDLAWAGGINAAQYGTIHLNGDTLLDLFIFDRTTNRISTFINSGTDYQYDPQYEYLFPSNLNGWVVLADYNCDGKQDIFTNTTFGLKVYKNSTVDQLSFELQEDPLLTESGGQMVNLQVSSSDIPAITDIDGDGDLDILTFKFATGNSVEYHQNQTIENNGNCEQLQFKLVNSSWGDFQECSCGEYAFGESCNDLGGRVQHSGGKALLAFDQDHDGAMDLVFGDEFCTNIAFMKNRGDADNALFTDASLNFPNSTDPIDFWIFPGMFLEDVNFDGRKDLLASPAVFDNFALGVDFRHSSHLYLNDGVIGSEAFSVFQTDEFLQESMIELGENAVPVFLDVDGDSDQDMIVGHRGNSVGAVYRAGFHLYENKGNNQQALLEFSTEDYLELFDSNLNTLKPSSADLDGDGRTDLLFSAADGSGQTKIYYFLNSSNQGFEPESSAPQTLVFNIQAGDHPHFVDINRDGKADLLLGRRTGRLEYWRNTSSGSFTFELVDDALAGIIDDSFRRELAPMASDIDNDGALELITSDATGVMRVYQNFLDSSSPIEFFDLVIEPTEDDVLMRSHWGSGASIVAANLGAPLPHLVVGSKQGGLFLLENFSESDGGPNEPDFTLEIFPNPGKEVVTLRGSQNFTMEIYNSLGQLVSGDLGPSEQGLIRFDSRRLNPGLYLINGVSLSGQTKIGKLIVAR